MDFCLNLFCAGIIFLKIIFNMLNMISLYIMIAFPFIRADVELKKAFLQGFQKKNYFKAIIVNQKAVIL
jgi:hypothetical protein